MKPAHYKYPAIAIAILLAAMIWHLPLLSEESRLLYYNNDAIYHFHMIQKAIETYPRVNTFDPFLHYPDGLRVHWLPAHTFLYATLGKIFMYLHGRAEALQTLMSCVPPFMGILAALLTIMISFAFRLSLPAIALAGLMSALGGFTYSPFFYGLIDHHLFTHLGLMLAVLGIMRSRVWIWSSGLLISLLMEPGASFYILIIMFALFASQLFGKKPEGGTSRHILIWYLCPAVTCLLSLIANRLLDMRPIPFFSLDTGYFTLFHFSLLMCIGITLASAIIMKRTSGRERHIWRNMLIASAALLVIVFIAAPGSRIISRVLSTDRLIAIEERSPLSFGLLKASPMIQLLCVCGIFWAGRLIISFWKRKDYPDLFPWLLLCAAFALSMLGMRYLPVLSGILFIGIGAAFSELTDRIESAPSLSPKAITGLSLLIAGIILAVFFNDNIRHRIHFLDPHRQDMQVRQEAVEWITRNTPEPKTINEKPDYGVFAPWSWGHYLIAYGGRPVAVDPFTYPVLIEHTLRAVLCTQSAHGLSEELKKRGIRYLIVLEPGLQILNVLTQKEIDQQGLVYTSPASRSFNQEIMQYAIVRLYLSQGGTEEFRDFKILYQSRQTKEFPLKNYGGALLPVQPPAVQIYQVL